jgi:hypothetical protein
MTITMTNSATNSDVKVESSVVSAAIDKAKHGNTNVVIYKAVIIEGQPKKVLSATTAEFNTSPNRQNLEYIATVDPEGNFVD